MWAAISAVCALLSVACTAMAAIFGLMIKARIGALELHISETRANDRDEMRRWINGSFMRSSTAVAKLETVQAKLDAIEQRLS